LPHPLLEPRPYLLNRSCFIAEPDQKYSARRQSPGAYTHSWFGMSATKTLFTLSAGQGCAVSGLVVMTFLPRTTPCIRMVLISLSTVQRAMSWPLRRNWCQTLRTPYRPPLPSKASLMAAISSRSCLARSEANAGSRSTALKA
ncbi:MAG: hypothetical protein LKG34_12410, partial [Acetobacter sp.]|nr:hypothetical protein [Acetobacter sp.]